MDGRVGGWMDGWEANAAASLFPFLKEVVIQALFLECQNSASMVFML